MPYIPPKRGRPGTFIGLGPNPDTVPIAQQVQINNLKKRLTDKATPAERKFLTDIAAKLYRRTRHRIRFLFQREFIVARGITFIVDFYFPDLKLAVEIDGAPHFSLKGKAVDAWRGDLLRSELGIRTIHFENREVLENPEKVWSVFIDAAITNESATPSTRKMLATLRDRGLLPFIWHCSSNGNSVMSAAVPSETADPHDIEQKAIVKTTNSDT